MKQLLRLSSAIILILAILNIICYHVSAKQVTVTTVGKHVISDDESVIDGVKCAARDAAVEACIRSGIYVESYTKTENKIVSHDRDLVYAGKLVKFDFDYQLLMNESDDVVLELTLTTTFDLYDIDRNLLNRQQEIYDNDKEAQKYEEIVNDYIGILSSELDSINSGKNDNFVREELIFDEKKLNEKMKLANYYDLGKKAFRRGDYKLAKENFIKVLNITPDDWFANHFAGMSCFLLSEYVDSIYFLQKSVDSCENKIFVDITNYHIGTSYAYLGYYKFAIEFFDKVENGYSKYQFANYLSRGYSYSLLGMYHEALSDYEKAIVLNPNDYVIYYRRAEVYEKMGDIERAHKDYKRSRMLREGKR